MKITFVKPVVTQNGGSRVVAIYAKKLAEMGHDVTVVSRQPLKQSRQRQLVNRLKGVSTPASDPNRTAYFDDLGARHVQVPWRFPLYADDIPDGDVVIATWWRTAFEVANLPSQKGKKAYFVQGHEVFHHEGDLGAGSYYLPLEKITISKWLKDILANTYDQKETFTVPNAIDAHQFGAPARTKADIPTIGLIYSPKHIKGSDIALDAIKRVQKTYPEVRIVAFGSSPPTADVPLPSSSHFVKLPEQKDIPDLYAQCDAWIMSSRTEGFGLPILEAMACRTPVVSTRTGASEDLIVEGVNGYVVDIDDSAAMAERLCQILALSKDNWQTMSQAAHATANDYSWDDAAKSFEAALLEIVEKA